MKTTTALIVLALVSACSPQQQQQADSNQSRPANEAASEITSTPPASRTAEAPAPPKAPPLTEPKGPIDPKSAEAAGQVVQHYGALIEQKRFADAAALWGDPKLAADFRRQLGDRDVHLEIGNLGETEGAAGSIYMTMPVVFYGKGFRRPADITLRRVNDVPGSTEQQRRWHIEHIEWKAAG
jgi:hypothetical protein